MKARDAQGEATLFNDNSLISVSSYSKGKHVRTGGGARSGQCIWILTHVLVHNPTGSGGGGSELPELGGAVPVLRWGTATAGSGGREGKEGGGTGREVQN